MPCLDDSNSNLWALEDLGAFFGYFFSTELLYSSVISTAATLTAQDLFLWYKMYVRSTSVNNDVNVYDDCTGSFSVVQNVRASY